MFELPLNGGHRSLSKTNGRVKINCGGWIKRSNVSFRAFSIKWFRSVVHLHEHEHGSGFIIRIPCPLGREKKWEGRGWWSSCRRQNPLICPAERSPQSWRRWFACQRWRSRSPRSGPRLKYRPPLILVDCPLPRSMNYFRIWNR